MYVPEEVARHLTPARRAIEDEVEPSRERSLVLTKLDEVELWLTRCTLRR